MLMTNKLNIGLVCSHVKRASTIKKILKQDEELNFCFDCRSAGNIYDHLKEYDVNVIIIDFHNALELGRILPQLSYTNIQIILICDKADITTPIPTIFFMYSLVDVQDLEKDLIAAIYAGAAGGHFYSTQIRKYFEVIRHCNTSPKSLGLKQVHINVLNSYLEGGIIREMAERVFMSEVNFKKHLRFIRSKFQSKNNNEIIDYLRKLHWCDFVSGKITWF